MTCMDLWWLNLWGCYQCYWSDNLTRWEVSCCCLQQFPYERWAADPLWPTPKLLKRSPGVRADLWGVIYKMNQQVQLQMFNTFTLFSSSHQQLLHEMFSIFMCSTLSKHHYYNIPFLRIKTNQNHLICISHTKITGVADLLGLSTQSTDSKSKKFISLNYWYDIDESWRGRFRLLRNTYWVHDQTVVLYSDISLPLVKLVMELMLISYSWHNLLLAMFVILAAKGNIQPA